MAPIWHVRLNDFLTWLNPALGLIALVLAAMVIAEAVDRLPMQPRPTFAAAQVVRQNASATRPPAALPPEWRELSRYD